MNEKEKITESEEESADPQKELTKRNPPECPHNKVGAYSLEVDHARAPSQLASLPIHRASPCVIETDSAELENGTQIELIENPEDSSRTLLAVFEDGQTHLTDRFESEGRIFVPFPRSGNLIRHLLLPRGVKHYGSVRSLLEQTISIVSQCLDLGPQYVCLLAQFILSTWFIERLPIAPYVAFVGPPRSGKSIALGLLRLLCRRALLTADITSAAFYRVCDRLAPTLLIDETGTAGDRRALFHILRTGTTRDVIALRKDQSFKTFGPKAISWTELPSDGALNSRCVVIPLHETTRTDLKRPTACEIRQAAEDLQMQFLQCRFEKSNALTLNKIEGDDQLHSRSRDLYQALALPTGEDIEICRWLIGCLKSQEAFTRAPLSPIQSVVLQTLFDFIHRVKQASALQIGYLEALVNLSLQIANETFGVTAREVGAALTALGLIRRKRTNAGWLLWLDREARKQIHDLVALYGVDLCIGLSTHEPIKDCDICKKLRIRED